MSQTQSVLFDPLTLGKRAQRIRLEKNFSIESLAKTAGVNKNTVVRFEKGIPTRMDTIYKICSVLGVSPLQLMEGKLIRGRDYDIQTHRQEPAPAKISGHVARQDRIQTDMHGTIIGDLNYRLPEGTLRAKVLEVRTLDKSDKRTHPGEELIFCLTGTVGIEISDVTAILKKGDAIFFWGTEPHCYFNADKIKSVSVALSVVCGES
ncbi:helix-turn-helix transcriptional regulator [bacterium]|nr:helix-turn-helix transcriptional regulator [bacterium]